MMKNLENRIVGISIGDLNGIGCEVVLKTLEDSRILELCTPVIFANVKIISFLKKSIQSTCALHGIDHLNQLVIGKINVLNVWREGVNLEIGKPDENVGKYAVKSFEAATKALKNHEIDVLITAPINKSSVYSDQFKFPGHTDYLNQELEGNALMLMVHNNLRIGLATDHVPVSNIKEALTTQKITQKIRTMHQSLLQDFGIRKPKIAVLGLNPHAGDEGVIGQEENTIIKPALEQVYEEGILAFGPFAADGFFGSESFEKYDGILAMYHDQGLIPFKTLSFGNGVNFTAGLSKVRTSPDHGTAFDIAGKNNANPDSFKEALYAALDIYENRKVFAEITANPLKIKKEINNKK